MLTVVTSTAFILKQMYDLVPSNAHRSLDKLGACLRNSTSKTSGGGITLVNCGDWGTDQITWIVGGVLIVFVVAAGLYLAHPWWAGRRWLDWRRQPAAWITRTDYPELFARLDGLRREMELSRSPRWLLATNLHDTDAVTLGLPGRRRIVIDAGLAKLLRADPRSSGRRYATSWVISAIATSTSLI
jgi:hypothetical protein